MAFADYDAYIDALRANIAADFQMGTSPGGAGTTFCAYGPLFVPAPAIPTASVALDNTSAFAINGSVPNAGAGRQSILAGRLNPSGVGGVGLMLVDILNMSGGLNATTVGAQSTNLPTAALTRYTNGEGVHAALIIHATIGNTATTVTVSYTNQSGTSGRTSTAVAFGSTPRLLTSLVRIPLEGADTGVRSVESVSLAATTGGVGNFGVVLYKPLAMMFINDIEGANVIDCVSSGRMVGQFNEVLDDACLSVFGQASTTNQAVSGFVLLGEA